MKIRLLLASAALVVAAEPLAAPASAGCTPDTQVVCDTVLRPVCRRLATYDFLHSPLCAF